MLLGLHNVFPLAHWVREVVSKNLRVGRSTLVGPQGKKAGKKRKATKKKAKKAPAKKKAKKAAKKKGKKKAAKK